MGISVRRLTAPVAIQSTDQAFQVGRSLLLITHPLLIDIVLDESFRFSHDRPGLLSMANRGPDTNSSQVRANPCSPARLTTHFLTQFFITTHPCTWCDRRNVIFGECVEGMDVVRRVQSYTSDNILRRPSVPCVIDRCGVLPE